MDGCCRSLQASPAMVRALRRWEVLSLEQQPVARRVYAGTPRRATARSSTSQVQRGSPPWDSALHCSS